jgi:hypothetical protein
MPRWMSLEYLRERWAEARGLGAWNLLFVPIVCVPLVGSVLLIAQGVDLNRAHVPGSVTIASCESTKGGWNCDGPFTATDGSVRVGQVRLYPYFAQADQPAGTVDARVSGPDATQADRSNESFPVPLWGGIALGLVGLYWVYSVYLTPGVPTPTAIRRRSRRR